LRNSKPEAAKLFLKKDSLAAVLVESLKGINALSEDKRKEAKAKMRERLESRKFESKTYSPATVHTQVQRAAKYLEIINR
jgi:hypothetical protein